MRRLKSSFIARLLRSRRSVTVIVTLLLLSIQAVPQNATGRIIGTIIDPQGATLPGAKVVVTNTDTSARWETVTGPDGTYQVLNLAIGNYRVTVEHEGFTKVVSPAQSLGINQSLRLDIRMIVGAVSQTVTVGATSGQVETVNPTVGGTVTGATIQNLPLNGRDTLDLALTEPGVTPALPSVFGATVPTGKVSVAGGRDNSITYLLNGGNNTSVSYGIPVMDPNPDTVAEFRVLENNYTAEYGRSGGGIVTVVTKSGTNQLHGSVFDYLRNDAFNANNFFNNSADLPRPVLKRNQFGGTIGGPITVPHLVNGKDRFFFFFGYQGQRQHSVTVGNAITTYTPAELTGDFSHSVNNGPDPNVVAFLQAHPYFQFNANPANAIIDPTKIDPVAQAYIKAGLVPTSPTGVLVPNGTATDNQDAYLGKLDFNATQKDRITVTLAKFSYPQLIPFSPVFLPTNPNVPGAPIINKNTSYFGNVGYTRTFSPNTLNEFHLTAQRLDFEVNQHAKRLPGPTDLGITGTGTPVDGPPLIVLPTSQLAFGYPSINPISNPDNTYEFSDTFTRIKGRHTLKAGGSLAIVQSFSTNANYAQSFTFNGPTGSGSKNGLADFLFGGADIFQSFPPGVNVVRSHQYAGFFQDEWSVKPRLVLTLGIRYEYDTPKNDSKSPQVFVLPGRQSLKYPLAPLGLLVQGDPGAPTGSTFPDKNNWAPRFGFAWDPFGDGKTSVRGGLGVFYDVLLAGDNILNAFQPPFFTAANLAFSSFLNGPSTILSNPYGTAGAPPPGPLPPAQILNFVSEGFIPFGSPSTTFIDPHTRTPYIYQYNLGLQRQLGKSLAAELNYVGSSSHKLTTQVDLNPIIQGTTTRILNTQPGLQIPNAFGAVLATSGVANASYNGLLASLRKQVGDWHSIGQTFFTLAYTWSHEIDYGNELFRNSSQVPAATHSLFRASGDADVRNRVVLSGGWEIPFAHMWAAGPKRLTRGWTLFSIITAQSGIPMDVIAGLPGPGGGQFVPGPSGLGDSNLVRPNWAGGSPQSLDPHKVQTINVDGTPVTGHFIFNPSGLSYPACFNSSAPPGTPGGCPRATYGTLPRNFFPGPDRVNFDLSLEKKTALTERVQLTFRAEFFNILNHTEWQSPPSGSATFFSPQLGQITSTYDPRIGQLSLRVAF
jgi:hypothetical protein